MPEERDFLDRTWVRMALPGKFGMEKIMIGIDPDMESLAIVKVYDEKRSEAMVNITGEDAVRTYRKYLDSPELKPYHMAILFVKDGKAYVITRLNNVYEPLIIDKEVLEKELNIDLSKAKFPVIVPLVLKETFRTKSESPSLYI